MLLTQMDIIAKTIYRLNAMSIKTPMAYFTELEQTFQNMNMEPQKNLNSHNNLEKEEQSWGNHDT